jgi:hypothetical protein
MTHVKTVPIMEELESVIVFDIEATKQLIKSSSLSDKTELLSVLNKSSSSTLVNVVAIGGAKGIIRFFILWVDVRACLLCHLYHPFSLFLFFLSFLFSRR